MIDKNCDESIIKEKKGFCAIKNVIASGHLISLGINEFLIANIITAQLTLWLRGRVQEGDSSAPESAREWQSSRKDVLRHCTKQGHVVSASGRALFHKARRRTKKKKIKVMLGLNKRRRRRWVNYIALRQVCRCNFLKFSKNLKHDAEKMQYLFSLSIGKKYIMHNYLLCIRLHFNLINNRIRGGTLWTFILGVAKGTW